MRKIIPFILVVAFACNQEQPQTKNDDLLNISKNSTELMGDYPDNNFPGTSPKRFAPNFISTGLYTRDIVITNDFSEIYFCVADRWASILVSRKINGKWTVPVIADFCRDDCFDFEPHISPDGQKFMFLSTRAPEGMQPRRGWGHQNIWAMDKTENGWSEPYILGKPISTENNEYFPSTTTDRTLYFSRSMKDNPRISRLYKSVFKDGEYLDPEMLDFDIPEAASLYNAFVSPDEDFIITCANGVDSTNTDADYYISFMQEDNTWGKLIRFGVELNPEGDFANSVFLSPDKKYLFFSSSKTEENPTEIKAGTRLDDILLAKVQPGHGTSSLFWVDASIIENYRNR